VTEEETTFFVNTVKIKTANKSSYDITIRRSLLWVYDDNRRPTSVCVSTCHLRKSGKQHSLCIICGLYHVCTTQCHS